MAEGTAIQHLISLQDWPVQEVDDLLDLSARIKRRAPPTQLSGKSVGLPFGLLLCEASLPKAPGVSKAAVK